MAELFGALVNLGCIFGGAIAWCIAFGLVRDWRTSRERR